MGKLYACASDTNKSGANQDYCVTVNNERLNFSGVIVADGIGSHFKSEIASKFSSDKLKELLEKLDHMDQLNFEKLFTEVKLSLIEFAKSTVEFDFQSININLSLGTTLICVIDCGNEYIISYVGNGSIWFIDGRFNKFGKNFYLPWNSINLLNPHSIDQGGQAALFRFISISDDIQHRPTIMKLNKNQFYPGEILVVTTDGIYSNDAIPVGKDNNETIWIKGEPSMPIFYSHLSNFLNSNLLTQSNDTLEDALKQFILDLKEKSLMHDDTTIGIIISEKTIDYHQMLLASSQITINEENIN